MSYINYKYKIIIFAHPRSGSTNLYRILNAHPALNLTLEPFHHKYGQWNPLEDNYIDIVKDIPSLDKVLAKIFNKYNGMKVLSYQLDEELYKHLLNIPNCKIIFLTRTNVLKAIVSVLIAEQTNVWQKHDLNQETSELYQTIKPLKIDGIGGIENRIKSHKEHVKYWDRLISQKAMDTYIKVTYEDLFCSGLETSLSYIHNIFEFLNLDMPKKEEIIKYIEPKYQQINDLDTYKLVPNIDEINRKFGNSENGFLF
jgi:LPS sulfotransferase NodH